MRSTISGVLAVLLSSAVSVQAATFVVDSVVDAPDAVPGDGICDDGTGACTLRAAVMESEAVAGPDRIELPGGVFPLTVPVTGLHETDPSVGDLDFTDDIEIVGAGSASTVIDASGTGDRVISFLGTTDRRDPDPPALRLEGLTLTGGATEEGGGCLWIDKTTAVFAVDTVITGCSTAGSGGGVFFFGYLPNSRMQLVDSVVSGNRSTYGGGIYVKDVDLVLERTAVTRNHAISTDHPLALQRGGGIYVAWGSLSATDSEISDNAAGRSGGGLALGHAETVLDRCTVSGNRALDIPQDGDDGTGAGAGIWVFYGFLTITNSTISGNIAEHRGGGVFFSSSAYSAQISHSTIVDNQNRSSLPGAGVCCSSCFSNVPGLRATIISGNVAGGIVSDCYRTGGPGTGSRGFNIDSDGTCHLTDPTDLSGFGASLAPLGNYGGPTRTRPLLMESPGIDVIPPDQCLFMIDNDRDQQIDEDPIDNGVDNDLDSRFEEDPAEPVDIDQRGVARPSGAGCDAGAVEGAATVEAVIEGLIDDVEAIIAAGELNRGRGRSLIAELQVALWFLQFNNGERIAIMRIELFIIKVERLVDHGDLDPELGDELLTTARAIIEMLR